MTLQVTVEQWADNTTDADPEHRVLVLPGSRNGAQVPGLRWPLRARAERQAIVDRAIGRFVDHVGGNPELVLAKSLGTLAAGWVADNSVPAVWTTPLLDDEECVENIARAIPSIVKSPKSAALSRLVLLEDGFGDTAAVRNLDAGALGPIPHVGDILIRGPGLGRAA